MCESDVSMLLKGNHKWVDVNMHLFPPKEYSNYPIHIFTLLYNRKEQDGSGPHVIYLRMNIKIHSHLVIYYWDPLGKKMVPLITMNTYHGYETYVQLNFIGLKYYYFVTMKH